MTSKSEFTLLLFSYRKDHVILPVMELFAIIVEGFQLLTVFDKSSIIYIWQGSKYVSTKEL